MDTMFMVTLEKNIKSVKDVLTSQDILVFEFDSLNGKRFAAIYADGIADKQLLGELVIKPLRSAAQDIKLDAVKRLLASPEVKDGKEISDAIKEVSDGNAVLFVDGEKDFLIIGLKNPPGRSGNRAFLPFSVSPGRPAGLRPGRRRSPPPPPGGRTICPPHRSG